MTTPWSLRTGTRVYCCSATRSRTSTSPIVSFTVNTRHMGTNTSLTRRLPKWNTLWMRSRSMVVMTPSDSPRVARLLMLSSDTSRLSFFTLPPPALIMPREMKSKSVVSGRMAVMA